MRRRSPIAGVQLSEVLYTVLRKNQFFSSKNPSKVPFVQIVKLTSLNFSDLVEGFVQAVVL